MFISCRNHQLVTQGSVTNCNFDRNKLVEAAIRSIWEKTVPCGLEGNSNAAKYAHCSPVWTWWWACNLKHEAYSSPSNCLQRKYQCKDLTSVKFTINLTKRSFELRVDIQCNFPHQFFPLQTSSNLLFNEFSSFFFIIKVLFLLPLLFLLSANSLRIPINILNVPAFRSLINLAKT